MFSGIHSLRKTIKQRSKSQSVTNRDDEGLLKTFMSKKFKRLHHLSTPKSAPLNMLLNGKNINDIIQKKDRGKTEATTPHNVTNLKQFIYRKYLTQHHEEISPHAEGIIKLRQMFNQRCRSRNLSEGKQSEKLLQTSSKWPKIEVRKVSSITNPDLNTISYISRSRKYDHPPPPTPFKDRYVRIIRQRQLQKKNLLLQTSLQRSGQQSIDPWQTDY